MTAAEAAGADRRALAQSGMNQLVVAYYTMMSTAENTDRQHLAGNLVQLLSNLGAEVNTAIQDEFVNTRTKRERHRRPGGEIVMRFPVEEIEHPNLLHRALWLREERGWPAYLDDILINTLVDLGADTQAALDHVKTSADMRDYLLNTPAMRRERLGGLVNGAASGKPARRKI